jgi:hypothetical protein
MVEKKKTICLVFEFGEPTTIIEAPPGFFLQNGLVRFKASGEAYTKSGTLLQANVNSPAIPLIKMRAMNLEYILKTPKKKL